MKMLFKVSFGTAIISLVILAILEGINIYKEPFISNEPDGAFLFLDYLTAGSTLLAAALAIINRKNV